MGRMDWKPFFRQIMIGTGCWTLYFMQGMCMGFPTVVVPQLRKANQNITDNEAAWIPATHTYVGIPWVILLSALIITIGRKKAHILVCISSTLGFIIFFFSLNITHILLSELFQGAVAASYLTTCITILTEFTSSKYRGIFLTLKSATFFWGILVANAIGTFFHWQNIATLGIVCGIYTLINSIFWPESPLWLASKGKFEECAKAHRWLKGEDAESEKELDNMIKSQERRLAFEKPYFSPRSTFKTISQLKFIKPLLLAGLLISLYCFSGKLICTVFALDMLKKITNAESTAYTGMLILDAITVFSMYLGCFLSRVLRRRLMLIGFTIAGIMFLILISIYLYLVKLDILENNKYISISLLAGYSISISVGPMIMSTSIIGELLPLESRCLSICIVALTFKVIYGTFVKLSPYCFKYLAMHGTFALYAILSTIILILIYFYLPETKDKTLQEIYNTFDSNHNKNVDEVSELMNVRNVTK